MKVLRTRIFDSSTWDSFIFRDDDVIIATYAKSGTTWMQQIVAQLVFDGRGDVDVASVSPFFEVHPYLEDKLSLDQKISKLEAQSHRRFLKSHSPADSAVYSPKAKYIYVARDGRDVAWSLYNHHAERAPAWYQLVNKPEFDPPATKPPASIRQYFIDWVNSNGHPYWPFWDNVRSWWNRRTDPNVMLVHFSQLKADYPAQIRRVAEFLNIPIKPSSYDAIVEHCSFDYMRRNAPRIAPGHGAEWKGGAESFFHKGTNGRWTDELTKEDCDWYEALAQRELGEACAKWLKTGEGAT